MEKLLKTDWLTFLDFKQAHQPPLVFNEYYLDASGQLCEKEQASEHIREYKHPATGNVCAMHEAPLDFHKNDDYANRVLYILGDDG